MAWMWMGTPPLRKFTSAVVRTTLRITETTSYFRHNFLFNQVICWHETSATRFLQWGPYSSGSSNLLLSELLCVSLRLRAPSITLIPHILSKRVLTDGPSWYLRMVAVILQFWRHSGSKSEISCAKQAAGCFSKQWEGRKTSWWELVVTQPVLPLMILVVFMNGVSPFTRTTIKNGGVTWPKSNQISRLLQQQYSERRGQSSDWK